MKIDLRNKAQQLLEALANSIHDRDSPSPNPFCFKASELDVAEKWLYAFILELRE